MLNFWSEIQLSNQCSSILVKKQEFTTKNLFVMRMSEKFKIEAADEIFRRRSLSYVEERFYPITKILDFAAIRNRKVFFGVDSNLMRNLCSGLIILFLLFIVKDLSAQDWKFGLQAGVVNSGVTTKTSNFPDELDKSDFEGDRIWAWQVNGVVTRTLSENFRLSAEPGYIRKGFTIDHLHNVDDFKLDYITLPILADVKIWGPLRVQIGPELSYRTGIDYGDEEGNLVIDWDDEFENWELSGLVGLSYDFNTALSLGLRYNHSVMKTTQFTLGDEMGQPNIDIDYYNQYASAVVRYNFGL
ncbi:MAG: PorT family protein [Saprospirales bacterium]|nr:MAG: PorT family protein [Saprospirales bacterium]